MSEDDPAVIATMLDYFYQGKYDYNRHFGQPSHITNPTKHFLLFRIADKFFCPSLKEYAFAQFSKATYVVEHLDLVKVIDEMCPMPELEDIDIFRRTLMCAVQKSISELLKLVEFKTLVSDANRGFVAEFLEYYQSKTANSLEGEAADRVPVSPETFEDVYGCGNMSNDHAVRRSWKNGKLVCARCGKSRGKIYD